MKYRKSGLRILGLSLTTAFVALALTATAAQAVGESLEFGINFLTFGQLGITKESVTGTHEGVSTLAIPSLNIEVNCKDAHIFEAEALTGGVGLATLLFLECTVLENVVGPPEKLGEMPCKIPNGDITSKVKVLGLKHNGVKYFFVEPATGTTLATIEFEKGTSCPLILKTEVKGTLAIEPVEQTEMNPQRFFADTASAGGKTLQALFGSTLKYGLKEAFVKGKMYIEMNGPNAGKAWGIR